MGVWLLAFFSPTAYLLLLMLAVGLHFSDNLPQAFVGSLFFLIPVFALLVCEFVLWSAKVTLARKTGLMIFTLLGILLQFGFIIVILQAILTAITAYPQ